MKAWPDWDEFVRRLREDAAFREAVRRQVLTEDLLNLPAVVQASLAALTEQVRENGRQIAALTEALREFREAADRRFAAAEAQIAENGRQIAALTDRMERAEAQIRENGRQIAALTEALREFRDAAERRFAAAEAQIAENSRQIAALTEALREFRDAADRRFAALERDVRDLKQGQARLEGTALEVWWTQYAPSYLGRWFRGMRVLTREALNDVLEDAEDEGRLTVEDAEEVRRADVVAVARDRGTQEEVWVVMEVSATVGSEDVTRAKRRADILARLDRKAVAVAAGKKVGPHARAKARELGVWVIEDGRRTVPEEPPLREA
jgi:hypothetical protein